MYERADRKLLENQMYKDKYFEDMRNWISSSFQWLFFFSFKVLLRNMKQKTDKLLFSDINFPRGFTEPFFEFRIPENIILIPPFTRSDFRTQKCWCHSSVHPQAERRYDVTPDTTTMLKNNYKSLWSEAWYWCVNYYYKSNHILFDF